MGSKEVGVMPWRVRMGFCVMGEMVVMRSVILMDVEGVDEVSDVVRKVLKGRRAWEVEGLGGGSCGGVEVGLVASLR